MPYIFIDFDRIHFHTDTSPLLMVLQRNGVNKFRRRFSGNKSVRGAKLPFDFDGCLGEAPGRIPIILDGYKKVVFADGDHIITG